jgi:hypothetical protein
MKSIVVLVLFLLAFPAAATVQRAPSDSFRISLDYYRQKTAQGASVNERIYILNRIISKYRGERYAVRLVQLKLERSFLGEWKSCREQAAAGASTEKRRATLERIRGDYLNTGVDLSLVENELALLPSPPAESPAPGPAVSAPVAHENVCPSTYTAAAAAVAVAAPAAAPLPSPPEPPQITKARTAKHFGLSAAGLGKFGLYGCEAVFNFTDRLSCSVGYGMNTLLKTPNPLSSAKQETYTGLLRYGNNVYAAAGLLHRRCQGEAAAGSRRTSGAITAIGVPLAVGVETGNKRGIYFAVECGYTFFFGDAARVLSASDPDAGATAELKLEAPESHTWFGLGFGFYFY